MKFVKPPKDLIKKSGAQPYINPIIGIVYWKKLKDVFTYLKKRRWELILEIGCGEGFLLPSFCQISDRVIGSDIESTFNLCQITLREFKKSYANLKLIKCDATSLSDCIDENSCDVIVAISVLEHINDYNRAIIEIHKCLKPDGIFVCVLPSENWLYKLSRRLLRYGGEYHKHYNYEKMQASLRRNFKEIEKWNCPFGIPLFTISVLQKEGNENN